MERLRRFILAVVVFSLVAPAVLAQKGAIKEDAVPLVTDQSKLPLSSLFGPPGTFQLTEAGDVYFNAGSFALFRWSGGVRSRLLQGSDPHPGFPGSVNDIVGASLTRNAVGHVAMLNYFFQKNVRSPRGIFVYDGVNFTKVVVRDEEAPGTGGKVFTNFGGLLVNNSDKVAFIGTFEPQYLGISGIFIGSPGGTLAKIAATGDPAPGTDGTFANFTLAGFNDAEQVLFFANIAPPGGGPALLRGLYLGTLSGLTKVVVDNDPVPGSATRTWRNLPRAALNAGGQVAFEAQSVDAGSTLGEVIWVYDSATETYTKLAVVDDPTDSRIGGNFGNNIYLRGFNSSGQALFHSNVRNVANGYGLFLKRVGEVPKVVFARGDSVPGGTTETFNSTNQTSLNNDGDVAFLATLQGGSIPYGWFWLESGLTAPVEIALESKPTPAGGTFGLAMELAACRLNESGQVAYWAEMLGPEDTGLFLWTPGMGNQAVVTTLDQLPAGANTLLRTFMPGASDDQLLFTAWKAGGRFTAFARPLPPAKEQFIRLVGEGDTAPGIGGRIWWLSGSFIQANNNEEAVFVGAAFSAATYPGYGAFTYRPGFGLRKLVATGDAAPGAAGGTFVSISLSSLSSPPARINSSGQVAFYATTDAPGAEPGVFISSVTGAPQAIARRGDPSPIGGTFLNFGTVVALTDDGRVAFRAVSRTVVDSTNVDTPGIFVGTGGGTPVKLMAQGDALGDGTVNAVPSIFDMNNSGLVAYVAGLSGGSATEGVFLGRAGGLQRAVALTGEIAPGTGGWFSDFREPDVDVNDAGQLIFWGGVSGSPSTTGRFLASETSLPVARLVQGQLLPGGGYAGVLNPAINNFIGDNTSLAESGEISTLVFDVTGAPNLPRKIIADTAGIWRQFLAVGEKAPGVGGYISSVFQSSGHNSTGNFFSTVQISEGSVKMAIYWNGGEPKQTKTK